MLLAEAETGWVTDLIKASPGLAVALILVIVFLKELRAQRQESANQQASCHAAQATNLEQVAAVAKDATDVVRQNSVAYGKVCEMLDGQRQAIADAVRDGFEKAAARG